jgi:hypothetical protein
VIEVDVPHLRIIEQPLWEAVQQRLATEAVPASIEATNVWPPGQAQAAADARAAFWNRRRPKHLLTGKVT